MFGEGLHDQDTLPSQFSMAAGRRVVNAGMHGYGSHQAYRLLDDPMTIVLEANRLTLFIG